VPRSMQLPKERIATSTPECQAGVLVVRRHHLLVRCSHWLNLPILLGLILSGVSIYWASPVYQHKPDSLTGNFDPLADVGVWICAHVPGLHQYSSPPDWVYNHISLGPGMLAVALRLHWLCAYLFLLNGLIFAMGLAGALFLRRPFGAGAEARLGDPGRPPTRPVRRESRGNCLKVEAELVHRRQTRPHRAS